MEQENVFLRQKVEKLRENVETITNTLRKSEAENIELQRQIFNIKSNEDIQMDRVRFLEKQVREMNMSIEEKNEIIRIKGKVEKRRSWERSPESEVKEKPVGMNNLSFYDKGSYVKGANNVLKVDVNDR
jgi:hypothetical protein